MVARGGHSQEIGEALQAQARQMFQWWHRVCDGTLTHASFRTYMQPIRPSRPVYKLIALMHSTAIGTMGTARA